MGEQNEYLCDLDGSIWNRMGTQNSKNPMTHPPLPSPPPRKKNIGPLECMLLGISISLMLITIFQS
jgi:hypothetical protein